MTWLNWIEAVVVAICGLGVMWNWHVVNREIKKQRRPR